MRIDENMGEMKDFLKELLAAQLTFFYGNTADPDIQKRLDWELAQCTEELAVQFIKIHLAPSEFRLEGNVSATLISHLLFLSEADPLPPHYYCSDCNRFKWAETPYSPSEECLCGADITKEGDNLDPELFFIREPCNFKFCILNKDTSETLTRALNCVKQVEIAHTQAVPHHLRLCLLGLEYLQYKETPWFNEFLDKRLHEAFIFEEDVYHYLMDERGLDSKSAAQYAVEIADGRADELPDGILIPGSWQEQYCRDVYHLPSKAITAEKLAVADKLWISSQN